MVIGAFLLFQFEGVRAQSYQCLLYDDGWFTPDDVPCQPPGPSPRVVFPMAPPMGSAQMGPPTGWVPMGPPTGWVPMGPPMANMAPMGPPMANMAPMGPPMGYPGAPLAQPPFAQPPFGRADKALRPRF
jgi:hypothetical protein